MCLTKAKLSLKCIFTHLFFVFIDNFYVILCFFVLFFNRIKHSDKFCMRIGENFDFRDSIDTRIKKTLNYDNNKKKINYILFLINFSNIILFSGPIISLVFLALLLYLSYNSHFNSLSESHTLMHRDVSINNHYFLQLVIFITCSILIVISSSISVLTLVINYDLILDKKNLYIILVVYLKNLIYQSAYQKLV